MSKKLDLATLSRLELTKKEMQVNGGFGNCSCYCICECIDEISAYINESRPFNYNRRVNYQPFVDW